MKEQLAAVVEDVLAVVGGIEQSRYAALLFKHGYEVGEETVGLQDGVVVCVEQLAAVLRLCLGGQVGQETRVSLWVTVAIVEM